MNPRDREQFEEFMTSRWHGLVRLAFGLTGDRWLAEDLAQTALASAYASWWRVSRADDPDAYVRRILINASKSRLRRRRVSEQPAATAREAAVPDPTASVDERSALLGALQKLPPGQRAVVVLRYWEDLTDAQRRRDPGRCRARTWLCVRAGAERNPGARCPGTATRSSGPELGG